MLEYFGDIPAGPPVPRQQPWTAPRTESTRDTMTDHVAQTRIYREWNVPWLGDAGRERSSSSPRPCSAAARPRACTSASSTRTSSPTTCRSTCSRSRWPSMFQLQVDVKKGVDPAKVEAAIAEEWARFLKDGPTDDELARVKVDTRASFIRGLERVNGKASILAEGQVYRGDPGAYKTDLAQLEAATPASVLAAAKKWIAKGDYTLTVTPAPRRRTTTTQGRSRGRRPRRDRRTPAPVLPPRGGVHDGQERRVDAQQGRAEGRRVPRPHVPEAQHGKLKNGIEVILAERHAIPVVQMQLLFDAGYASDQGRKLGTSSVHDGDARRRHQGRSIRSRSRERERAARRADQRGLAASTRRSVSLSALTSQLKPSLALFADIVRNPAFRDDDIARMRGQWLARIAQEKTAADAASRCARCRRCCTAKATRMRFRSPAPATKPRSTR